MILAAPTVLDVGRGTGSLLGLARDEGHTGRMCGRDPSHGMLAVARQRGDIEWLQGDLAMSHWDRAFDLVVMTGHAFQELREDREIQTALTAIRAALVPGGRFALKTRIPVDRGWERWEEPLHRAGTARVIHRRGELGDRRQVRRLGRQRP